MPMQLLVNDVSETNCASFVKARLLRFLSLVLTESKVSHNLTLRLLPPKIEVKIMHHSMKMCGEVRDSSTDS
jgi:hypothetical protein